MDYLKLPLDLPAALGGQMERCSYEESIAQHIMMLVVSRYGEVESKDDYGSVIWNLEYNQTDFQQGIGSDFFHTAYCLSIGTGTSQMYCLRR